MAYMVYSSTLFISYNNRNDTACKVCLQWFIKTRLAFIRAQCRYNNGANISSYWFNHTSPKKHIAAPKHLYLCFAAKCFKPPLNLLHKLTTPHSLISLHYIHSFTAVSFLPSFLAHRTEPDPWSLNSHPKVQGHRVWPFGCFVALCSLSHPLLILKPSFGQLLVSFMPLRSFGTSFCYLTPRS